MNILVDENNQLCVSLRTFEKLVALAEKRKMFNWRVDICAVLVLIHSSQRRYFQLDIFKR